MEAVAPSRRALAASPQADRHEHQPERQLELGGPAASFSGAELVLVGLLISLILISIVGNCLVCVAIFTDRRLRKLGNAFIVSLAIADLFVSCLVMTFALCNDLLNYWPFGESFCDVWISFDIMCSTASILNLCAISLDRFVHIKDCLLYGQYMTKRVALSAVAMIWFISGLVSFVPINLGWHKPARGAFGQNNASGGGGATYAAAAAATNQVASANSRRRRGGAKLNYPPDGPLENRSAPSDAPERSSGSRAAASTAAAADRRRKRRAQFNQVQSNPLDGPDRPFAAYAELPTATSGPPAAAPSGAGQISAHQPQLPQCVLTLTPTYAIVSSTISFYIPCVIMLGLYTKLFACARRHVRNIRAVSRRPRPIKAPPAAHCQDSASGAATLGRAASDGREDESSLSVCRLGPARAWLKFGRPPAAANSEKEPSNGRQQVAGAPPPPPSAQAARADKLAGGEAYAAEREPFLARPPSRQVSQKSVTSASATTDSPQQQPQPQRAPHKRPTAAATIKFNLSKQQQQQQTSQLATHKAAVTLGIIMGTFLFCWVPFFCLNIIKAFCVDCIPSSLFRAFTWLGYANSALNPIIYGIHNSEFRNAFNRIFFKHLTIKNGRQYLNRRFSYDVRARRESNERRPPPATGTEVAPASATANSNNRHLFHANHHLSDRAQGGAASQPPQRQASGGRPAPTTIGCRSGAPSGAPICGQQFAEPAKSDTLDGGGGDSGDAHAAGGLDGGHCDADLCDVD